MGRANEEQYDKFIKFDKNLKHLKKGKDFDKSCLKDKKIKNMTVVSNIASGSDLIGQSPLMLIDDNLESRKGDFHFDRNVAYQFDSHIGKSVPFYTEVQRMIEEMSDWFIHDRSWVYDLGCSTGETISRLWYKHAELKNPSFFGLDSSKEMIEVARHKINGLSNVSLYQFDLNQPIQIMNASLVTMLYTLQFLKPESRPRLLETIYKGLNDNGALILLEKISGNNPNFNELWIELYNDLKIRNGLSLEQIKSKADSLRGILLPYSQEKNISLLKNAGFTEIDIFFKWYNFIGIVAVK